MTKKSLAETHPEIAKQWHPTKNGDLFKLGPENVTNGSHKKVWWKCPKGDDHEWKGSINDRKKTICPICSGKKVVKSNCLATLNPKLSKEWHPTKNNDLTPYDVTIGSQKKVWWKCPKGDDHEWKVSVATRKKNGCPVCNNSIVVKSNSLAHNYPKISNEWHPTKNGNLTPDKITAGSATKAWWICKKCKHEWESVIRERIRGNNKCKKCQSLGILHSELSKEWHPTKNNDLTPYDVTPGSHKKVWWKCSKGDDHEWEAIIKNRSNGAKCSICAGRTLVKSNSLKQRFPKMAKEWHPTKNGNLTPDKILSGSHKKVWWQCQKDKSHEWKDSPNHRSHLNLGCTYCAVRGYKTYKTGYLYIDMIFIGEKEAFKIGISNNRKQRIKAIFGSMKKGIIVEWSYFKGNGERILEAEGDIKKNFKLNFLKKHELEDGYTETFSPELYDDIDKYISEKYKDLEYKLVKKNISQKEWLKKYKD